MATKFLYDIRDHLFIYKEWLDLERLLSFDAYKEYFSIDDVDTYLNLALKLSKEVLAPVNDDADSIGAVFADGNVSTPPSFKSAYKKIMDAGLGSQMGDREAEGKLPLAIYGSLCELFTAACSTIVQYWGLSAGALSIIQKYGNEQIKSLYLPKMISGEWGGTMNLTESDAGSDVGEVTTKAFPTEKPGVYKIKGLKQFISSGDHDLTENIIHLVLARIEGAKRGTAGLSLFIVPKYWVNEDGSLGNLNDVQTLGIEHKMGFKGSATCTLSYGENNQCFGVLLGDPPGEDGRGAGIAQMFDMMNEERLNVGQMSAGHAGLAYYNSLAYAKERIQGRPITDPRGNRVALIQHEDIQRMLLYQKSIIEAMRAMNIKTYLYIDLAMDSPDNNEKEYAQMMYEINVPICKAFSSDMVWKTVGEAIQIYGGYGYMEEYPLAQIARDCKIHSIWEGTNYIQAMDLVGRKFTMAKGKPFMMWLSEIKNFIKANQSFIPLQTAIIMLEKCFSCFQEILTLLQEYIKKNQISMMPWFATRILYASALLYSAYLLLDQAIIASNKLQELGDAHYNSSFYSGKIASANFFVNNIVPDIFAIKEAFAASNTLSVLNISPEAY